MARRIWDIIFDVRCGVHGIWADEMDYENRCYILYFATYNGPTTKAGEGLLFYFFSIEDIALGNVRCSYRGWKDHRRYVETTTMRTGENRVRLGIA